MRRKGLLGETQNRSKSQSNGRSKAEKSDIFHIKQQFSIKIPD
jgi:hypothetical protein